MQTLDWIVIALFCLALIGIIVWVMRQKQGKRRGLLPRR